MATATRPVGWQRAYGRRLAVTDTLIVIAAVFGAQQLRFGQAADLHIPRISGGGFGLAYTFVSVLVVVAWLGSLKMLGTRSQQRVGGGWDEYRLVLDASLRMFGLFAIAAFLLQVDVARGYLLLALPVGLAALVASRWAWRQWLGRQRAHGRFLARAVVVGEHSKTLHVARELQRDRTAGIVVSAAITERDGSELLPGVPMIGSLDDVVAAVEHAQVDTVVYSGSDLISPAKLRQFGWDLQSRGIELVVAAALTDVAGPRLHARPVAGLSLLHVDSPEFTGARYITKRAFDIIVSGLALVLLSPLLLMLTLRVRADGGPALFRQQRVGLDGHTFTMFKFRSMVMGAEAQLADLLAASDGNGMLFKMRDDPRVTPIGRTLRRLSLDELPQLLNVIRGDMSLVGPRPPLMSEVSDYEAWAQRRLLVKPGITGLWQVSGRSDLSWEDSLRLDLYYVENWSLADDMVIIWRTVRAVVESRGAY
ncbi:sugar transferase [Microbacterium sp. H1-D42]|uniref:sugar transferase n=1 Tax=Microbacterium sp. H1-D42 TaxID=2925844 RepID=UPI001F532C26|nr:sugar transferase [Microbacterium sp. H1-D42]UNK70105.1 sugar transferase [Microbacterium sp. H1-D42]